jgi:hypothetical protein
MTAREALAQEWRDRLEDFALSEMTVQQWCDFNALPVHQYHYWRRRLAAPKTDHNDNAGWMALSVIEVQPLPTSSGLTLRIAGAEIQITSGFDPSLLRAVVGALATPQC